MLIVHLITDLSSGGAQRQLQQFVLASDKRRFNHIVISLRERGPIGAELEAAGVAVRWLGMSGGFSSPLGVAGLIRLLRRIKPDVLHCWLYHACLVGVLGGLLSGVRHLVWGLRSANPELHSYGLVTRIVVHTCARLSFLPNAIVANSQTAKAVHEKFGYRKDKISVISNGIDGARFFPEPRERSSVREELRVPPDAVLVGMIARYHPVKDHETFMRAATLIHPQDPRVHFLFAGEGMTMENHELSRLVQQTGLQSAVHLLGPRRDIPRLTAALDIACLSSWSESFPSALLEAMACAVPCVATHAGDSASIVGDTGRIVPSRDPVRLAAAMAELIAMPPAELAALGRQARERVLIQFALPAVVNAYEELYEASCRARDAQCCTI